MVSQAHNPHRELLARPRARTNTVSILSGAQGQVPFLSYATIVAGNPLSKQGIASDV
jgi:hypothetical protein